VSTSLYESDCNGGPLALRVLEIRDNLTDTRAGLAAAQLAALYERSGRPELAEVYRERAAASPRLARIRKRPTTWISETTRHE
jgi:hypothetical protein